MKNFKINKTTDLLIIKRNFRGLLALRSNIVLSVLVLSTALAFVLNLNIERINNKTIQFWVILSICILIACAFFYSSFFEKAISLRKLELGYKINNQFLLSEDIVSITVEEYVSSEAITGNGTIKIKSIGNSIVLLRGVSLRECEEIVQELLEFLKLDNSKVKSIVC